MKAKKYPSKEFFLSIFDYVDGKLFYRKDYKNKRYAGLAAGREQRAAHKSYWQVRVDGKMYYAHRVIWIIHNGDIPENLYIDHINGCGTDNRLSNLRIVDRIQNNRNKRRSPRGSKSGYTGVTFDKSAGMWKAHIEVLGKHKNLGLFKTPELAYERRLSANAEYGFESSHGAYQIDQFRCIN